MSGRSLRSLWRRNWRIGSRSVSGRSWFGKRQIQEMILQDAKKILIFLWNEKSPRKYRSYSSSWARVFRNRSLRNWSSRRNVGKNVPRFPVRSRMRVRMVAFSKSDIVSILRESLEKIVDPGMHLSSLETETILPEVLSISPKKIVLK